MSIVSGLLGRDIRRTARDGGNETKLIGRPVTGSALVDANFYLDHGMSREQWAEMIRERNREDRETIAVADLEGEPPVESLGSWVARGNVPPQRMRLARFVAWRESEASALAALVKARAKLVDVVEAPIQTQLRIGEMIKTGASRLLAAIGGNVEDALDDDAISRRVLDERLSAQRHRAEAAREAIVGLDPKIAVAQLRVARLRERESEFLRPALFEYADAAYATTYLAKVAELRKALMPLLGLSRYLGYESPRVALPSISDLPTLKAAASDALSLRPSTAAASLWTALAKTWAENPFAEPPAVD
jgi:hypothetical protein